VTGPPQVAAADLSAVGLNAAEVRLRTEAGQVNTVPPGPGRGIAEILRANVLTRFNAILGAMFVVVVIVGPPQDALFGVVLVVNTGIGVAQELRTKRALDRLAIVTAARARAVRDGAVTGIPLERIVTGDVLELRRGDQVPVDGAGQAPLLRGGLVHLRTLREADRFAMIGDARCDCQGRNPSFRGFPFWTGAGRLWRGCAVTSLGRPIAGEAFGARLDAEQHLALHDQAARLHEQQVEGPGGRRQARRDDPVPADQPGRVHLGQQCEDPHPVPVGDPDRQGPLRVEHLYPHDGPAGTQRQFVAGLEALELRKNLVGTVHVQAEEVLDPVVGVGAAAAAAHLHEPRPDGIRRGVDRDRAGGHQADVREQLVAGQFHGYFAGAGAPGEAPAAEE
jgi:hypothetical protein